MKVEGPSVGLIAGAGHYPICLARRMKKACRQVVVAGLTGQSNAGDYTSIGPYHQFHIGTLGAIVSYFKANGVRNAYMAGAVRRQGVWRHIRPDWDGIRLFPKAVLGGDNALLTRVAGYFGKMGIPIDDPGPFISDLFAREGLLCGPIPSENLNRELITAWEWAVQFSKKDEGQSVTVYKGRLWGLEDRDGTDVLLARTPGPGAVMAKIVKQGQDRRFDLPTIGPSTILVAHRVGLSGIIVQAGGVLLLDRQKIDAYCRAYGISVVGI